MKHMHMRVFTTNLRNRIRALNLTEAHVARLCGLSERRFTHYTNGTREPDISTLVIIAVALKTSVDDLVLGKITALQLPKDHQLLQLGHIAQQLSCADIEIITEMGKTLLLCRKKRSRRVKDCDEKEQAACLRKFKHRCYNPSPQENHVTTD